MSGYQVLRKLADGAAAEVFLAREEKSVDRVVIEVIRPELTSDFAVYGRFLDEAHDRQRLVHPNLLRRRGTGCAPDGRLYTVTEPIDGEHLGSLLIANGPLAPAELVRIVMPLCDALEYLHGRGKVHGHLRPSNVFLTRGEGGVSPKLLDTGLTLLRPGRSIVTPSSLVLVEPEYLSPERIRGRRATALSDVYGLGVLIYEALSGKPPFSSADPALTRRLHLEAEPPALPSRCDRLAPIVLRCLAKNPARRYPSIAAVRQALAWHAGVAPSRAVISKDKGPVDESVEIFLDDLADDPADAVVIGEPVGEVLGSYELEDLLGQGGMGRVFLARHLKLGRRVALKVLRPELASDPTHLQRFFQEARAVNRVNNPHIVQIFDLVEEPADQGGRVYCVMEPLVGRNLRELAARGPMSIGRAVGIVRQVCTALQSAHEVGIVHRDIKPDNIFLVDNEAAPDFVKVLDFGIAKLEASAGDPLGASTRTGVVVGTPSFMAPEQALGDEVDARADVYSLGTVLYALLTGKCPFEGHSMGTLLSRLVTKPAPRLPELTPGGEKILPALREAVARCLAKRPSNRFGSMTELSQALAAFEPAGTVGSRGPVPPPLTRRRDLQVTEASPLAVCPDDSVPTPVGDPTPGARRSSYTWLLLAVVLAALVSAGAIGFVVSKRWHSVPRAAPTQASPPRPTEVRAPGARAPAVTEGTGPSTKKRQRR